MKDEIIAARVHEYTGLMITIVQSRYLKYSQKIFVNINQQVINAAIGMHGAGKYRAQCGLVEEYLMFIGLYGKEKVTLKMKLQISALALHLRSKIILEACFVEI